MESKKTNAGRVLMAVYKQEPPVNLAPKLLRSMSGEDCWLKVFIILLQLNKASDIQHFWDHGILDRHLPMSREELPGRLDEVLRHYSGEDRPNFIQDFFHLQHALCTDDSLDSASGKILESTAILPFYQVETVNADGTGNIHQIRVPPECIPSRIRKNMRTDPYIDEEIPETKYHEFALKVLKNEQDYNQETFAYRALEDRTGIVQCLGFWQLKKDFVQRDYHLLLEYGDYDLHEYFETFQPPSLPGDISQFWMDLSSVVYALGKIHNLQDIVEGKTNSYYGWHGDIKPENILYCKDNWKIADPGFAHFVLGSKVRRDKGGRPVINLRGGTTTYAPPEFVSSHSLVTQGFDIWSLGCVFSEAATWILLGPRGVKQYRYARKSIANSSKVDSISLTEITGDDCFHNNESISQAVIDWHEYLKHSLRQGDKVTGAIIDLIEKRMLLREGVERMSAVELETVLQSIFRASAEKAKSSKLPVYQPPGYFRIAFEVEHEEECSEQSPSSTRRSNRYKSVRLKNSGRNVSQGPECSQFGQFQIQTPLLKDPLKTSPGGRKSRFRIDTPDTKNSQESVLPSSQAFSYELDHLRGKSPYGEPRGVCFLDYWGALRYLESQGWVDKSTLIRPGQNQSSSLSKTVTTSSEASSTENIISPASQKGGLRSASLRKLTLSTTSALMHLLTHQNTPASARTSRYPKTSPAVLEVLREGSEAPISVDDRYKNSDLDEYFKNRDIVFLVDNGSTMCQHWPMMRSLVIVLAALLYGQDDNGMDIYFTSSNTRHGPFTEPTEFVKIINKMEPAERYPKTDKQGRKRSLNDDGRANDIRTSLNEILSLVGTQPKHMTKENYTRKLTLIIFTDGRWVGIKKKRTVAEQIVHWVNRWGDKDHLQKMLENENRGLSFQFVQFGNDKQATKEFEYMDNDLANTDGTRLPDIIDVEPADGNVNKMILGSVTTYWDGGSPETIASEDSLSKDAHSEFRGIGSQPSQTPTLISQMPLSPVSLGDPADSASEQSRLEANYDTGLDTRSFGAQFVQSDPVTPSRQRSTRDNTIHHRSSNSG